MFNADKTRMIGLPYCEKNYDDVKPFSSNTETSRTERYLIAFSYGTWCP